MLHDRKGERRCHTCIVLTRTYPDLVDGKPRTVLAAGQPFTPRLTVGEFAVVTPEGTTFWSKRDFTQFVPGVRSFSVRDFRAALVALLRDPPPIWLAVGFARSNDTTKMFVNEHNAIVRFSGVVEIGFVSLSGLIARQRVMRIKQILPLTGVEWREYFRSRTMAFEMNNKLGEKARATQQRFEQQHPGLLRHHLPVKGSPEAALLEIL